MNTARVIAAINPDILACIEVEDRPGLVRFNENVLAPIFEATAREPYPFALVVDGNDARGIDVGILSRHPITDISTHVFDLPGASPIFSRDCAEYFVEVPGIAGRLIIMVNHFASKGSDPTGMLRRVHQANRVRDIVAQRRDQGFAHIVVAGDLNDTPGSASLANLIAAPGLTDAVKQFAALIDPTGKRLGTYETGKQQIDYLMMSDQIAVVAHRAGIERRGHFAPRTFKSFDTVKSNRDQASDHHCVCGRSCGLVH
ncbi:MAG: endonuclease/exonuclease/phosphatase family protein [Pseudomonadota bacterium]|nr:endonuclease/exonuclease/phosphatase family protein [Pseudomonadota bacterium]